MTMETMYAETDYEPPAPPPKPRLRAGFAALMLAIGAAGGAGLARWASPPSSSNGTDLTSTPGNSHAVPADAASIASKVSDAVVDITITNAYTDEQAAGTGIVLTSDGEVLTNNHVISGATTINGYDVGNGKTYSAKVLGYDRSRDIAVIKLQNASGLTTATLGNSSEVQSGDTVVGVGNAGGRGGTPSYAAGSVTGLDQPVSAADPAQGTVEQLTGLIETDANIVAGDSGGPLVDTNGHVVGVITAGSSSFQFRFGGGGASDGFAVPINTALSIVHQVESGSSQGSVHVGPTAFLGVMVQGGSTYGGATIAQIVGGAPADQAGLSAGDTITRIDGHMIGSPTDLSNLMQRETPDRDVSVTYVDQYGTQHTTTIHLAAGPAQ